MTRNDFLTAVNNDHGICGFISFYMSFKDYRVGQQMANGDAALAQALAGCLGAHGNSPLNAFLNSQEYTLLRDQVLDLSGRILNAVCDTPELQTEVIRFTNPFLVFRQLRPWTTWRDVHDVGLGEAPAGRREEAVGVGLTKVVVDALLTQSRIPFAEAPPFDAETLLADACPRPADYSYCLLGIGPEYYAPRGRNPMALEAVGYAGLLHWIYVDKAGNVSNYGVTRQFAQLLDILQPADEVQWVAQTYRPNNWSIKHMLRVERPRVIVAVRANALHGRAQMLGADPVPPTVRYATGDDCTGKPDEFIIQGENFRGDKNVALKIFPDGQQASIYELEMPYGKIKFERLPGAKTKTKTEFETVAINPQTAKLVPGYYTVKAYVDGEFETECKFSVVACVPVKKPIDWGTVRTVVAILVGIGLVYFFYLTAKRGLLAKVAQRFITLAATQMGKNAQGVALYEYEVLKEGPVLAQKGLFSQSYAGVTIEGTEESATKYTISGTSEALSPLLEKLGALPVVCVFPAEDDTELYTYWPNKLVKQQELGEVLNEGKAEGDKRLLASPGFLPVKNLLFGQKLSMGQFFYDPTSNRLLLFQRDRNLVLYDITDPVASSVVWTANTNARRKWAATEADQCYLEVTREEFRIHDGRAGETAEPLTYPVQAAADAFSFNLDLTGSTLRLTSNLDQVMESPQSKTKFGSPNLEGLIATNGL